MKLRKENIQHVNTGDPLLRAPKMEKNHVFSRPIKSENDLWNGDDSMIGELNPKLEEIMKF